MKYVTIVPPAPNENGAPVTRGTVVLMPDGSKIPGVTKVTIEGGLDDLWRARIECVANVPVFPTVMDGDIERSPPMTWWRRLLLRAAGVYAVDIMDLAETEHRRIEFVKVVHP